MLNQIIIEGRLTADPVVKITKTNKTLCRFTLAIGRPWKKPDGSSQTDFFPVVVWGKAAEMIGNSMKKGQRLLVEGRLQIDTYEVAKGGKRRSVEVVARTIDFIEKRVKNDFSQFGPTVKNDEEIDF